MAAAKAKPVAPEIVEGERRVGASHQHRQRGGDQGNDHLQSGQMQSETHAPESL